MRALPIYMYKLGGGQRGTLRLVDEEHLPVRLLYRVHDRAGHRRVSVDGAGAGAALRQPRRQGTRALLQLGPEIVLRNSK